ncbi:MAG: response regulator transcription factor [Verrucomicrobiales bacterium]|nr:response regulator transcription factor [Verrucomicrobiales bacterium]
MTGRGSIPCRLLLADDHSLVRAGIRALLEKIPGVEVVGEAGDGREVLKLALKLQPDVVLLDISMPGLDGLETARRLIRDSKSVRVLMLSMHQNEEYYWKALQAGASGYLLKRAAVAELELALRRVMAGEVYLSPGVSQGLVGTLTKRGLAGLKSPLDQLTPRQREILQLIAEGRNTKAIADLLTLSSKTVEYHRLKLMHRLNLHDIPGLVRFAFRSGLVAQER